MKPLNQNELFNNLKGFLKTKGVELEDGSYTSGIQKSCSLLSDAINLGQQGLGRAKAGIDRKLDQMRQVIHEKTAPRKPASAASTPGSSAASGKSSKAKAAGAKRPSSRKPKSKA